MAIDLLGPANAPGAVTTRPSDGRSFGSADTFFKDCSSPTLDDGTEFQAAWFNQVLDVLRGLARGNGLTGAAADIVAQDNADGGILLKSIQHLIQRGQAKWAIDTGTANNLVVTLSPAPPEYKAGMTIEVKIASNCTGATVINVNGLGNKNVTHVDATALIKDDLVANSVARLVYDGAQFQLTSIGAPAAKNRKFATSKASDQTGLANSTFTDVSFAAATCAFGTFNGTTFTFGLPGTYIVTSSLYIGVQTSAADYLHTAGNFVLNGSGFPRYGDAQVWVSNANTIQLTNWGVGVIEANANDTLKIQAYGGSASNWLATTVKAGASFFDITRIG